MGGDIEPNVAHQDGAAFEVLLMEKLTALAGKPTHNGRRIERSVVEVDEINAPLPGRGIVESQRLRLDAKFLIGAGHIELFEVCVAVEKLMMIRNAVVLDPDIGVVKPVRKAADVRFPVADEKVKVVRAIALRKQRGIIGSLGVKRDAQHHAYNKQRTLVGFHPDPFFQSDETRRSAFG